MKESIPQCGGGGRSNGTGVSLGVEKLNIEIITQAIYNLYHFEGGSMTHAKNIDRKLENVYLY